MAYRFLLEVPETRAAEANIAVGEAGDAQVVVVRNSHGRNLDEPYVDLTVAAHSLRVIHSLASWYQELGATPPEVGIVLHSGDRIQLGDYRSDAIVAMIRRDQPWVERSIPKIGDHERDVITRPTQEATVSVPETSPTASTASLERSWSSLAAVQEPEGERRVTIRELNHIAIHVADLPKAESFYVGFLSMDLVGRGRRTKGGGYETVEADYDGIAAIRTGTEADVTFLRNGPLVLALHRVGRGARLERGVLDHVSIRVDAVTYTAIKGQVLMQSMELIVSAETAFAFRDPMGVTWEITLQSLPDFM